ncbi:hypothetical protein JL720_10508 [Aureococcus anophagefferens]|nr:hypothetical protein JL720_10508 [Aureococcus anophagefferens]
MLPNCRELGVIESRWWAAPRRRRSAMAEMARVQDATIFAVNKDEETALHVAARAGSAEGVRLLLAHGAVADARDGRGRTALHLAASRGLACWTRYVHESGDPYWYNATTDESQWHAPGEDPPPDDDAYDAGAYARDGADAAAPAADNGRFEKPRAAAQNGRAEEPRAAAQNGRAEEPRAAAQNGRAEEPRAAAQNGRAEEPRAADAREPRAAERDRARVADARARARALDAAERGRLRRRRGAPLDRRAGRAPPAPEPRVDAGAGAPALDVRDVRPPALDVRDVRPPALDARDPRDPAPRDPAPRDPVPRAPEPPAASRDDDTFELSTDDEDEDLEPEPSEPRSRGARSPTPSPTPSRS